MRLFHWLCRNWGEQQLIAMADLVHATREIAPDWKEISIQRKSGGVIFSVVSDSCVTVKPLEEVA